MLLHFLYVSLNLFVQSMSQGSSTDKQDAVSGETDKITEKVRKDSTEETVRSRVWFPSLGVHIGMHECSIRYIRIELILSVLKG